MLNTTQAAGGNIVQIAGIDGCKSRWIAIAQEPGLMEFGAHLLETNELAREPWKLAAIDIPIGLTDRGAREADRMARRYVGPRRSSVFPSPIRPALAASSWREASDITFAQDGRRISQQTFGILPKIRAVDECIRSDALSSRFFEIHPEVSFAAWQGMPMMYPKRDPRGHAERRALIAAFFGAPAFESGESQVRGQNVAPDDIADAFAALWSANRIHQGTAGRFPAEATSDAFDLPMHIWY
jgi:predicted RNase H-like nuclease